MLSMLDVKRRESTKKLLACLDSKLDGFQKHRLNSALVVLEELRLDTAIACFRLRTT
jgi:hypothetical protein